MRSRSSHALFTLTTLVVAALVWLVPSAAHAEGLSTFEASVSASFDLHVSRAPAATPPAVPLAPIAPDMRAPLCDPRGATTFAPPPQMQDVEATLDTGLTLDDCFASTRTDAHANRAAPGRAPLPTDASSASSDAAVITARVMLAACARELLPAPSESTSCSRPGIRSTVDRPPRA